MPTSSRWRTRMDTLQSYPVMLSATSMKAHLLADLENVQEMEGLADGCASIDGRRWRAWSVSVIKLEARD